MLLAWHRKLPTKKS